MRSRSAAAPPGTQADDRRFLALEGLTFSIEAGEVVGIIGRNGSGKTTLLKVLSRVTPPTDGTADLYGRVGALLEVGVGFHPELTGRENIYLSGAVLGMRRHEIRRRFDEIVAFAEIPKFVDTPVKRYSLGMVMRLGFSVAAHLETDITLVDELLSVGDAAFRAKCLAKLGAMADNGRTVLLVSHDMAAVTARCTRALRLDAGRLVADGPAASVVSAYLEEIAACPPVFAPSTRHGGVVRISAVAVQNDTESPASNLFRQSAVAVRTTLEAETDIPDGYLTVTLHDATGRALLTADERDASGRDAFDPPDARGISAGLARYAVTFPKGLLAAGDYSCTVRASSSTLGHLHEADKCVSFTIQPAEFTNHTKEVGFLTPSLPWRKSVAPRR